MMEQEEVTGPLSVGQEVCWETIYNVDGDIVAMALSGGRKNDTSTALRITASWNACAGIDTADLTPGKLKALRDENARLREALEPFAEMADAYDPPEGDDDILVWGDNVPNYGQLRRARAALAKVGKVGV